MARDRIIFSKKFHVNYNKISYCHFPEYIQQILMPRPFLTLGASQMCQGCFFCAFRKAWRTFSKVSDSPIVNTDLHTIINPLMTRLLELPHKLSCYPPAVSLQQSHISPSGEGVKHTVYCSYLRSFFSLKVNEMLFKILQSSINTL